MVIIEIDGYSMFCMHMWAHTSHHVARCPTKCHILVFEKSVFTKFLREPQLFRVEVRTNQICLLFMLLDYIIIAEEPQNGSLLHGVPSLKVVELRAASKACGKSVARQWNLALCIGELCNSRSCWKLNSIIHNRYTDSYTFLVKTVGESRCVCAACTAKRCTDEFVGTFTSGYVFL